MIVDGNGRAVSATSCPQCGSPEKNHETSTGFGGHWSRHCKLCGYQFDSGKKRGADPVLEREAQQ